MSYTPVKTAFLKKIADSVDMSFDIPDSEKEIANDALIRFEAVLKKVRDASEHLDIIYEPFKRHENISTKSLVNKRGLLNRYKQKVKFNYNEVKAISLLAIRKLNYFATGDTSIQEIINSFVDAIEDLEKRITKFLDIMGDYESPTFREDILSAIDGTKAQSAQLETLLRDRIIDHIDTNILAKSWMNDTREELKLEMEDKIPLVSELFEERQKALDPDSFPESKKLPQALNVSDAQRAYYPDHVRHTTNIEQFNIGEFGGF